MNGPDSEGTCDRFQNRFNVVEAITHYLASLGLGYRIQIRSDERDTVHKIPLPARGQSIVIELFERLGGLTCKSTEIDSDTWCNVLFAG